MFKEDDLKDLWLMLPFGQLNISPAPIDCGGCPTSLPPFSLPPLTPDPAVAPEVVLCFLCQKEGWVKKIAQSLSDDLHIVPRKAPTRVSTINCGEKSAAFFPMFIPQIFLRHLLQMVLFKELEQ